jgi:hypothetical protein
MKAFLKTHWRGEKRHRYFTAGLDNVDVVHGIISAASEMKSYSTGEGAILGHFGELAIDMIAHPDRSITRRTKKSFPSKNGFHVC